MNRMSKTMQSITTATLLGLTVPSVSAETLLGKYFEIETGARAGTEVVGKVHLVSNRATHRTPIPASYRFAISADPSGLFRVESQRDSAGRLFGTLRVAGGRTVPAEPTPCPITVTLVDGRKTVASIDLKIQVVERLMQEHLLAYALKQVGRESRLYGRRRYKDSQLAEIITELEEDEGRFRELGFYTKPVTAYKRPELESEWEEAARRIGGLGYAYARSKTYGPEGDPAQRARLKRTLCSALAAFIDAIPFEGDDVIIDGKPIGPDYGDGFFLLNEHKIMNYNFLSHPWRITDPVTGPVVWLMPELGKEVRAGDASGVALHEKLIRLFQICFGNPRNYRKLDDPRGRWGRVTDPNHSEGGLSDANLGHKIRGWVVLPAIWADYNRPITYTPEWYVEPGRPQLMPGWTPTGVLDDLHFWVTHFHRPAHQFRQSGFHPDGTVTHHLADASDIAMAAYGFGWLTGAMDGYELFRDLPFDLGSHGYQFIADRLLYGYDKMLYKDHFDYVVTGRSYWGIADFGQTLTRTVDRLLAAKQEHTLITNEDELVAWRDAIAGGTHAVSGSYPFWVGNYLLHRRGGQPDEKPCFMSVKLKNDRTTGAEDFEKVLKSWHTGSGILQVMTTGREYSLDVRRKFDWHVLPGLTEEWRTKPVVYERHLLRGANAFSGVASDGRYGFAAMQYRSESTNASAQADKAFFFAETEAIALGCEVKRRSAGEGLPIVTTLDQTRWVGDITYSDDGVTVKTIPLAENPDLRIPLQGLTWIHQGSVGYVVFPQGLQPLTIRGGSAVNTTDRSKSSDARVIHLAVGHGVDPPATWTTRYHYAIVPNITAAAMPDYMSDLSRRVEVVANHGGVQGIYDRSLELLQAAFQRPGIASVSTGLEVAVDRAALVQLRKNGGNWELCVTDPLHELAATEISVGLNVPLKPGRYAVALPGIHPRPGEPVTVTATDDGVSVRVPLPDPSDDAALNYQAELYAGVPIHVTIPGR